MNKRWESPPPVTGVPESLKQLNVSPVVVDILAQRGIWSVEQAVDFLRPSLLQLSSPYAFKEMNRIMARLEQARQKQEKILIYGDYDVDGVTSTALLYKVFKDLGFKAVAYIPHRMDEGYGLNNEALLKASQSQVAIVITVDCGITAVQEVAYARTLGMDIIVTDHHEPLEALPDAYALLNPKLKDSGYPFPYLAGVGVAFKLAQALLEKYGGEGSAQSQLEILDLVALGTIADLAPLVEENRNLVAYGLKQMEKTVHLGLQTLLEECGLAEKPLKAGQIAFTVAPRINAAGRMDSAKAGLELLLTGNQERARELSRFLSQENSNRQETEKRIFAEALAQLAQEPLPRVIVLSAPGWHHGVIGIVASRLVERFYRPVFLIAEEDQEARGSARGIPSYHVLNELQLQSELLERFGGHKQAAGFSLKKEAISLLREGLNRSAAGFAESMFWERLPIDRLVQPEEIDAGLMADLEHLAPFGIGNPTPVLAVKGIELYRAGTVGADQSHLKCTFGSSGQWEGIAFRQGRELSRLTGQGVVDVAFGLEWNTFRGEQKIQLLIKDIQAPAVWAEAGSGGDTEDQEAARREIRLGWAEAAAQYEVSWQVLDWRLYRQEQWQKELQALRAEPLICDFRRSQGVMPLGEDRIREWGMILGVPTSREELKRALATFSRRGVRKIILAEGQVDPDQAKSRCRYIPREDLVQIYRLVYDLAKQSNPFTWKPEGTGGPLLPEALMIFEELGLLRNLGGKEKLMLEWVPAEKKLDLESSLRYRAGLKRWEEFQEFCREYEGEQILDVIEKGG